MLIEGVFAAVPTPFYSDERIYFRKLEANVARYSRSLLAGMVVLGSTGEAVALNDSESRDASGPSPDRRARQGLIAGGPRGRQVDSRTR
jgi:dihydrodipicolinate synthase/N-acetylneuraminate lyase